MTSVQHVVMLRFTEALDREEEAHLRSWLSGMPELVPGFLRLRFGADRNGGARAHGYDYLMLSEHADVACLNAYLDHGEHRALGAWIAERGGEVMAFDYEVDSITALL